MANTSQPVAPAGDHRFHVMDPLADLEGYAEFEADYHSLGLWYNHRLGVEIRNVDRNYSGPLRTYESAQSRAVSWGQYRVHEGYHNWFRHFPIRIACDGSGSATWSAKNAGCNPGW